METKIDNLIEKHGSEIEPELIKAICVSETSNERYESACDNLENLSAVAWCNSESKLI